jgi:cytochrome P450
MTSTRQRVEVGAAAGDVSGVSATSDFADPALLANPFPTLARLRAAGPIHPITLPEGRRAWLVTRFADALQLLKDARVATVPPPDHAPVARAPAVLRLSRPSMLEVGLADHARLRGLVSKAFTPRFIEGLQPRIQQIADALIDAVLPRGEMEFIGDFAFPLPITVICEMLGIPPGDHGRLRAWTAMLVDSISRREDVDIAAQADAFEAYITDLIAGKRRGQGADLLSQLVRAEEAGETLDTQELRAMTVLLIVAGHETTVNLLGNGMLALFAHPAELDALKRDLSRVPAAVEELLRYVGPAMSAIVRYAMEDMEIGGTAIPTGEVIVISIASADRDEEQFHGADALDIARANNKHLALGHGIHYCLGAPLARLEAQVALTTLLRRLPGLRLNAPPEALRWRGNFLLRGLQALPVAF